MSDYDVIQQFKATNDQKYAVDLYMKYKSLMCDVYYKYEPYYVKASISVDDFLQEAFFIVLDALRYTNLSKITYNKDSWSVAPKILLLLKYLAKKQRRAIREYMLTHAADFEVSVASYVADTLPKEFEEIELIDVMKHFNKEDQKIFYYRYIKYGIYGMTISEISLITGLSLGYIHRILMTIEQSLYTWFFE